MLIKLCYLTLLFVFLGATLDKGLILALHMYEITIALTYQ